MYILYGLINYKIILFKYYVNYNYDWKNKIQYLFKLMKKYTVNYTKL